MLLECFNLYINKSREACTVMDVKVVGNDRMNIKLDQNKVIDMRLI